MKQLFLFLTIVFVLAGCNKIDLQSENKKDDESMNLEAGIRYPLAEGVDISLELQNNNQLSINYVNTTDYF